MIDEKVLVERLDKYTFATNTEELYYDKAVGMYELLKIVKELAEEHNKKYEPTMDLIEHGVEGYIHHLEEQYKKGYAEGWHDCSCTIQ